VTDDQFLAAFENCRFAANIFTTQTTSGWAFYTCVASRHLRHCVVFPTP
jgi:hypothetical protein